MRLKIPVGLLHLGRKKYFFDLGIKKYFVHLGMKKYFVDLGRNIINVYVINITS